MYRGMPPGGPQAPPVGSRLDELLANIRQEFDQQAQAKNEADHHSKSCAAHSIMRGGKSQARRPCWGSVSEAALSPTRKELCDMRTMSLPQACLEAAGGPPELTSACVFSGIANQGSGSHPHQDIPAPTDSCGDEEAVRLHLMAMYSPRQLCLHSQGMKPK